MRFKRSLLAPVFLLFAVVFSSFARFRWGNASLSFYDDDFFYYLKVAQNLAARGQSSFDGLHLTNGYHPLWLLVLTVFARFLHGSAILYAVQVTLVLSVTLTYAGACRCLRTVSSHEAVVQSLAALLALYTFIVVRGGMEVILTVPLLVWFCALRLGPGFSWRLRQASLLGLLGGVAVLSRLDSIVFVGLFFVFEIFSAWRSFAIDKRPSGAISKTVASLGAACVGCALPLVLYVGTNVVIFHTLTPISGQAKQLRWHHWPSVIPVETLMAKISLSTRLIMIYPVLAFAVAGLWFVALGHIKLSKRSGPLVLAALCFPFVHLLAVSIMSDWAIWPWYLYSLPIAFLGGALAWFSHSDSLFANPTPRLTDGYGRLANFALGATVALLLLATVRHEWHRRPAENALYVLDRQLADFAGAHAGRYAMGDSAATFAYLTDSPVVQLEGLVMDKPYLAHVRAQEHLNHVLALYGIRYYVATVPRAPQACYDLVEPMQAGPDSPHMRDSICQLPVAKFFDPASGAAVAVFDLTGQSALATVPEHPKF